MADDREHLEHVEDNMEFIEETTDEDEDSDSDKNEAMFIESRDGKIILEFNKYKFRKVCETKNGSRWNCMHKRECSAFVYLNKDDEIIMTKEEHNHRPPRKTEVADSDKGI